MRKRRSDRSPATGPEIVAQAQASLLGLDSPPRASERASWMRRRRRSEICGSVEEEEEEGEEERRGREREGEGQVETAGDPCGPSDLDRTAGEGGVWSGAAESDRDGQADDSLPCRLVLLFICPFLLLFFNMCLFFWWSKDD